MINRDDWLEALGHSIAPPDPDAVTVAEFAAMFGLALATASRRLKALVAEGKAQQTYKIVPRMGGVGYRSPAFRLVKAPAKTKGR
jgi:DNA-binding IclR family transcriptional regulator